MLNPAKVDALIVEDMTPRNVPSSGTNVSTMLIALARELFDSCQKFKDLDEVKSTMMYALLELVHPVLVDKERVLAKLKDTNLDIIPFVRDGNGYRVEFNDPVIMSMFENDALVQNLPELDVTFNGDALFLYGSKGFFNLHKDASVKKLFPYAIIKRIEGGSHMTHVDFSEEYIRLVSHFIDHRNMPESKI